MYASLFEVYVCACVILYLQGKSCSSSQSFLLAGWHAFPHWAALLRWQQTRPSQLDLQVPVQGGRGQVNYSLVISLTWYYTALEQLHVNCNHMQKICELTSQIAYKASPRKIQDCMGLYRNHVIVKMLLGHPLEETGLLFLPFAVAFTFTFRGFSRHLYPTSYTHSHTNHGVNHARQQPAVRVMSLAQGLFHTQLGGDIPYTTPFLLIQRLMVLFFGT